MSAVREGFACSGPNGIAKMTARTTIGAKYRPAKSLSFPVRNDGHTCLSRWSLIKRIAIAASDSGLASAVRLAPRPTDGLDRLPIPSLAWAAVAGSDKARTGTRPIALAMRYEWGTARV